jgi:hypothetical protein
MLKNLEHEKAVEVHLEIQVSTKQISSAVHIQQSMNEL